MNNYAPNEKKRISKQLNTPHADWLAAKLDGEAITLVKNKQDSIPLTELNKKKIAVLSIGDTNGNEFQQTLTRYDSVACFSILRNSTPAHIQQVYRQLEKYDVIVCAMHTVRIPDSVPILQLSTKQ